MYNKSGLKFFIYKITHVENDKLYMFLPYEIRRLIWKFAHTYPYVNCYICDKVVLNLSTNMEIINSTENYSITNGLLKCNNCYLD